MITTLVDCEGQDREYKKRLINDLSVSSFRYEEVHYRPQFEKSRSKPSLPPLLVYYEKEREWILDQILESNL